MIARNFITSKGTELPLLNLRGKEYLEVKFRLVWFREDHPDWSIETELMSVTDTSAYARATVRDESGRIIATSHKFESTRGFPDFIEKAETGAIGRALALIGYGTQFCADELDEGNRIVDAPVSSSRKQDTEDNEAPSTMEPQSVGAVDPADYLISFGRKYKGKRIGEIPKTELESYLNWLESSAVREGTTLSYQVKHLKDAYERLYAEEGVVSSH